MSPKKVHWTPTPNQELLLKSACSEPRHAFHCWEQWRKLNDIETLDPGSYRLLPMMFKNIGHLIPIEDEWHEKLKGTLRKSWFSNNMIQATAALLFSELKKRGIRPLLLKGLHLINSYYDDMAARPLGDADFLVSWEQAAAVDEYLRASGWKPKAKPRFAACGENCMSAGNGINYVNEKGYACDLHWNVMAHRCYPDADREMVERAVNIVFAGDSFRALCPEDLILHLLEHGAYGNPVPSIRWIPDVLLVLKKEAAIDWERFLARTFQTNLEFPVRAMLEYLLDAFHVEQIAYPLKKLAGLPATKTGKVVYRNMFPARTALGRSLCEYRKIYFRYQLFMTEHKKEPRPEGISGWMRCLKFRWNVKKNVLFPIVFMQKFCRNFLPYILGQLNFSGKP